MKRPRPVAYISGAIIGHRFFRIKFFFYALLLSRRYVVLNPAVFPEGLPYDDYMHIDYSMIDVCNVLILLPCWRHSSGANLEKQYATSLHKSVLVIRGLKLHEV
jgi:hypothetical protein